MAKYLHISFNFEGRPVKMAELQPMFNNALDWVRYAPNCWIVYTTTDPQGWYKRLKPLLNEDDGVFICEINVNDRYGYLSKTVWDWLNKKRS